MVGCSADHSYLEPDEFGAKFLDVAGSRVEAADAIDDFGYKVRTLYPHPIALRWRMIEAGASSDGPIERHYRAILNTAAPS